MLAIRFGNAAAARAYLRNADLQNLVSGITSAPDALSVAGHRTAVHPHSAGYGTFGAGTIIRHRYGSPSLPCGSSRIGPRGPRE